MSDGKGRFGAVRLWLWRVAVVAALLGIAAGGVYWFRFAPVPVEVVPVGRGPVVAEVTGTGTLEARTAATISPKISGRITRVVADQGDVVAAGALLVQLEDDELRQQVGIAEANVDAANATIARLKADKERAVAIFDQADRAHTRLKQLRQSGAVSADEYDRATESLAVATADIARSESAIAEGQKALITARKTLEFHQARLTDTRIVAPFAGLVVARHRAAGDVAVPGSAILTVVSTEVLWVRAWVDETEMAALAVSQPARVVFRSKPDRTYAGTVARLGRQTDRETREFVVEVRVDELPSNWTVGQRAEVYIETRRASDALHLPARAVASGPGGAGVFVGENGVARWRPLTLGLRGREAVAVEGGLEGSEAVIVPTDRTPLTDGRRVRLP